MTSTSAPLRILPRFRCGGGRDDAHAERLEGRGEQHDGIAMVVDDQGLDSRKYRHWVTSHIVPEFGQSMGRARDSARPTSRTARLTSERGETQWSSDEFGRAGEEATAYDRGE